MMLWRILGSALCCAAAISACGGGGGGGSLPPSSPQPTPTASPNGASAIKHVVVIFQENRTFDNFFNGFPGADTAQSGTMSNGSAVAVRPTPLGVPHDLDHSHRGFARVFAGGKLFFDLNDPSEPAYPYHFTQVSDIAPYWSLAKAYTLADRAFQSNSGPSYPSHQYLIAAQSAMADENPSNAAGGWGCDDAPGTTVSVLGANGADVPGPFPCFDYQTIGDELDAAGITWRFYTPAFDSGGGIWNAYDAVRHIRFGPDWTNDVVSPETTVLSDIKNGTLPAVAWITPNGGNSDHAPNALGGPAWVSSIVDAIGASPDWSSTAIFITWDDWGGWFDHVVPPTIDAMGPGFRVPILVVSPFARKGYVSHVTRESPVSILAFIEKRFGLAPLTPRDAAADAMADCFDFSQPVAPLVPVARARYPMEWRSPVAPDDD